MRNDLTEDELDFVKNTICHSRWEIAPGIFTNGDIEVQHFCNTYEFDFKTLRGNRVIDIGAWDGGFSFYFESLGAEVTAVDVQDPDLSRFSDFAKITKSRSKYVRSSVYDIDCASIGLFDVCFFQGVFYHLKHPIRAFERINSVLKQGGLLIGAGTTSDQYFKHGDKEVSLNVEFNKLLQMPVAFFVEDEFVGDRSNWFIPNSTCLKSWLKRTGFECKWMVVHGLSDETVSVDGRSVAYFLAEKVTEPEHEHPFGGDIVGGSELGKERREAIAITDGWPPDVNRSPPRMDDLIKRQTTIDQLLSTIEDHLHQAELRATPRQALPERLKKRYFLFRLRFVERLILRIHRALFFDAHRGGQELANAMRLCATALRHQSHQFGDLIRLTRKMSGK